MKHSFVVFILLLLSGVFFISGGIGLRSMNSSILALGIALGITCFLVANYLVRALSKTREKDSL